MRHLTLKFCCSIRPVLRKFVHTPVVQNKRNYPGKLHSDPSFIRSVGNRWNCITYFLFHNIVCIISETLSIALPKRFYRRVDVVRDGNNSYEITLDQKKVKTPQGNILKVYNETLALAVAAEWDGQKDTLQRNSMHLVSSQECYLLLYVIRLAITQIENSFVSLFVCYSNTRLHCVILLSTIRASWTKMH